MKIAARSSLTATSIVFAAGQLNCSAWFGDHYDADSAWTSATGRLYQIEHGWLQVAHNSGTGFFLRDQDKGWRWTSATIYPYLYSHGDGPCPGMSLAPRARAGVTISPAESGRPIRRSRLLAGPGDKT